MITTLNRKTLLCVDRAYPEHLVDAWMEGHTQFQPLYEKKKIINTHINHHLIIIRLNDDTKFDINKQYTGHGGKYTFDTSLKLNPNWHTFAKIFHNGGCSLSCHIYENEQTIT